MADWGGGRKWWLIRSPRLTFSIASFLLTNPSPHGSVRNCIFLLFHYLVGSKYLLLISTASTCFEFENIWFLLQCYAASISSTLGGSNCSRPPWLVLGRLCLDLKRGQRYALRIENLLVSYFDYQMACARSTLPRSEKEYRDLFCLFWKLRDRNWIKIQHRE